MIPISPSLSMSSAASASNKQDVGGLSFPITNTINRAAAASGVNLGAQSMSGAAQPWLWVSIALGAGLLVTVFFLWRR